MRKVIHKILLQIKIKSKLVRFLFRFLFIIGFQYRFVGLSLTLVQIKLLQYLNQIIWSQLHLICI